MEDWLPFIARHGYSVMFAVGFAEFIGLPFAGAPFVIVAGALAAGGVLHPLGAGTAVMVGALLADGVWFALARRRGCDIVDRACRLSSHPRACVLDVTTRLRRLGPRYLVAAKLLPGPGSLVAAAAGFANMPARTFLPLDAAGLAVWTGVYLAIGWIFAPRVTDVLHWVEGTTRGTLAAALLVIAVVAVWRRHRKARLHRGAHSSESVEPEAAQLAPAPDTTVST